MPIRHLAVALLGLVTLAGCSASQAAGDADVLAARTQVLLTSEPENAVGILEIREDGIPEEEFTLVGRVGGVAEPWSPGEAAFIMSDPVAGISGDHECGDDCAFCKKKNEHKVEPWAIVQFTDDSGIVLPIDARKLLALEESQTVVVRGRATVDSLGNLIVSAKGIYIRR